MRRTPTVIEILQATLKELEKSEETETPAMVELRRHIIRTIAELKLATLERSAAA